MASPPTEYGGLKVDQAKRFKELEQANARLKRLLADAELVADVVGDVVGGAAAQIEPDFMQYGVAVRPSVSNHSSSSATGCELASFGELY